MAAFVPLLLPPQLGGAQPSSYRHQRAAEGRLAAGVRVARPPLGDYAPPDWQPLRRCRVPAGGGGAAAGTAPTGGISALALGLVGGCGASLCRAQCLRRRAYSGDYDQQRRAEQQTQDFWRQRERHLRRQMGGGLPSRLPSWWQTEEKAIFGKAHVVAGINFDKYDDIPVEREGGQGTEEIVTSFDDLAEKYELPEVLRENFHKCGYNKPTPVQMHAMPAALMGTDVMVCAQTGSGKTAAFLAPIVAKALEAGVQEAEDVREPVKPRSLVLAPTRELCMQTEMEARRLCFQTDLRVVALYGGTPPAYQLRQLAPGCEILVATPGRLEDFLDRGVVSMENIRYFALDEADRMLDMGFEPSIRKIVEDYGMPEPGLEEDQRNTIMFSATFPQEMKDMALDYLDPTYMWIGVGRVGKSVDDVEQRFEDMRDASKFDVLVSVLESVRDEQGDIGKALVFANTKAMVNNLQRHLDFNRIPCRSIHGDFSQAQREYALRLFKEGKVQVLIATDVAQRGLDLPGVDHVVNFDLPNDVESYTHRIGRTGRIGNKGIATSMVTGMEPSLPDIVSDLQEAGGEVPDFLREMI